MKLEKIRGGNAAAVHTMMRMMTMIMSHTKYDCESLLKNNSNEMDWMLQSMVTNLNDAEFATNVGQ